MPRVGSSKSRTSGSVKSHLPRITFCWLPPERLLIFVSCVGVLVRIALMDQPVSARMDFSLKAIPFLCFLRLDITVFSLMFRIPKIPVARRSSVSMAKPFLMDSLAFRFNTCFPSNLMVPDFLVAIPKIFSSVSVRPLPSRPARPTISPLLTLKDTSFKREYWAVSPSTSRATSPGLFVFGGNWLLSSRPTISLIISSVVRSFAGFVAIHVPSRITVTSSAIRRISAILWEI